MPTWALRRHFIRPPFWPDFDPGRGLKTAMFVFSAMRQGTMPIRTAPRFCVRGCGRFERSLCGCRDPSISMFWTVSMFLTHKHCLGETEHMSSAETKQLSAVETGQMSAAETIQMSAVETRQMTLYSIMLCRISRHPSCLNNRHQSFLSSRHL